MRPKPSLEDIAGRLAVLGLALDRTTLGRIERQERAVFDYEILALAKALRVPPISLLDPDGQTQAPPARKSSRAHFPIRVFREKGMTIFV
ncbi:MAG: hypothetical protein LBK99_07475 [Opitutaceae bacterium]|nr:hypothetical protein [Opitutaceae bacterium]